MSQSEPSESPGKPGDASESSGLFGGLAAVWRDTLRLAGLETRLAGISLAWMLALALVAGLLLVSAWLMFNFAIVWWASGNGWSVQGVLLLLALIDLLGAILSGLLIVRLARRLSYPATARQLQRIATLHKGGSS